MTPTSTSRPTTHERARGIDRLFKLYRELHAHGGPMSVRELVDVMEAPRSSVYDLVNRLTQSGWLESDTDGRLFFGRTLHFYGLAYAEHNSLLKRARPVMRRLSATFNETTQLCTVDGNKYTVMLNEHGSRPFKISSEVGVKVPIPWTASGRILLRHLSRDQIRELIPDEDFALPHGGRIDVETFFADIDGRHKGYAMTEGLVDSFACCMAAPLVDVDGRASATLCFTVARDTTSDLRERLIEALVEASRSLSY